MDNDRAGSDAAIPRAGNEVFPGGQSADGTAAPYHHRFDPNCEVCRMRAYERFQEEIANQPLLWEPVDPTTQFYELPRLNMPEDDEFPSLSDFEDVTYFNQPYLVQYQEQQEQQQYQQQPFPTLLALAEEQQPAFGLQPIPDEVIEPLLFQQMASAEAFQPTMFESAAVEPLTYEPAAIEPTMFEQPMMLEHAFVPLAAEASAFEPVEFNFNTLPHGSVQQPSLGEPWAITHDGVLFEPSPSDHVKPEVPVGEGNLPSQMTVTTANVQNVQNPSHYEQPSSSRVLVRAPRRLLPSNGHRERPVHRQPEARARRLPALQLSSQAGSERAAKDLFLVQSRLQGMSYKDIKRIGNFKEAESTLRGRHRTLTKDKKDRVRDPKWTEIDVHLLKEAVRVLGHGLHPDRAKLSWMAVSKYISNHGGSYGFGYSTCHRRWVHLEATGQLGESGYDDSWVDDDDEEETFEDQDEDEEGAEESEREEDQDSDMEDGADEEFAEEKQEASSMVEKDEDDEEESDSESESSDDDDDNGVSIKTEVKAEE